MKLVYAVCLYFCLSFFTLQSKENQSPTVIDLTDNTLFNIPALSLHQPAHFTFRSQASIPVIVKATQQIANLNIHLSQCQQQNTTVDIPASYRQPEYIAFYLPVDPTCMITIRGNHKVDTHGQTHVTIQTINNPNTFNLYQILSQAGSQWHLAQTLPIEDGLKQINLLYQDSEALAKQEKQPELIYFSQYQQSVVSHYSGNYAQQANIVQSMLSSIPQDSAWHLPLSVDLALHFLYEENNPDAAQQVLKNSIHHANEKLRPLYFAQALEAQASIKINAQLFAEAIPVFHRTYDIFLAHGALAKALNSALSLGYFYLRNGDLLNASSQYNSALILATQLEDEYSITNANIKLSTVYRNLGQLDKADQHISVALSTSKQFAHSFLDAWAHQEKARLLVSTEQKHFAMDHFELARQGFQKVSAPEQARKIDLVLADLYLQSKDYPKAMTLLTKFLQYAQQSRQQKDVAKTQAKIARVQLAMGEAGNALSLQQQAHKVLRETDDAFALAQLLQDMAVSNGMLGNIVTARAQFLEAAGLFQTLQADIQYVSGLYDYARAIEPHSQEQSTEVIRLASETMLDIHGNIERSDLRRGFLAHFKPLISQQIHVDHSLSATDSLLLAELVRAEDLSRHMLRKQTLNHPPRLTQQNKLTEVNKHITRQFIALKNELNSAQRQPIMTALRHLSEQRYKIEKSFYDTHSLLPPSFNHHDLQTLQQSLDQQTMVLFLETGEQQSHSWKITAGNIEYSPLPAVAELKQSISTMLSQLKQGVSLKEMAPQLNQLSARLLGNSGLPAHINSLISITDGPVIHFPLSLLKNLREDQFLFESVDLFQHHSLKALLYQMNNKPFQLEFNNALVIANPLMLQATETTHTKGYSASNLPYSELEARSIKTQLPDATVVLSDSAASKTQLLSLPVNH